MTRKGFLGYLVWYSVSNDRAGEEPLAVTRDRLKELFMQAGIDTAYLPPPSRAIDAFRVATSNVTDSYVVGGITYSLFIREVEQTADYVTRNVIQLASSPGGRSETKVGYLQFFRPRRVASGRVAGTERLRVLVDRRMRGVHRERAEALVTRCQALYEANRGRLNAHALRAVVRGYLANERAVSVAASTGGWYVIPPDVRPSMAAMREVLRQCGDGCQLRLIPLVDEPDLRDMITDSVDADIAARAGVVVRDVSEWVEGHPTGTPTTARWTSWRADCQVLAELLEFYAARYNTTFDGASAVLQQAEQLVEEVGRRIAIAVRSR